jgi:hypothetical protein
MAKGKKRSRNGGGGGGSRWTESDHIAQVAKKQRRSAKLETKQQEEDHVPPTTTIVALPVIRREDRTSLLTHNTQEKRDSARLKLHISKVKRQVDDLRRRLTNWDPVLEAKAKREEEQKRIASGTDSDKPKKKKGRLGPETWKLRGAARPAWEVYDFDTRYVDPYAKDHENAAASAARSQNLLRIKSAQGSSNGHEIYLLHSVAPEESREYLGLLMQLGYLCQEAKQFKTAREAFLECIELEGNDVTAGIPSETIITSARESLMRMYLDLQRYDAAFRLGERLKSDGSCMIRFSTAILAMTLQKDEEQINALLVDAVRSNIFATYYLCYYDIFVAAIEYTDDLAETDDEPQSTFEEALEYCSSQYSVLWRTTAGATSKLKCILGSSTLSSSELEWDERLAQIESQFHARHSSDVDDSKGCNDDFSTNFLDIPMFANMFRTAMDMVNETNTE